MKQTQLPRFEEIRFYPGYSYTWDNNVACAPGRYVAIANDGRAYHFVLTEEPKWEIIG